MATKSIKRIHKVTIKRILDDSPDTSWLGEYSNKAKSDYAIDRAHSLDCQSVNINHDAVTRLGNAIQYLEQQDQDNGSDYSYNDDAIQILVELQEGFEECDCGGRGDMERGELRYFNGPVENYKGESPEDIRKYIRQDYERMESLNRGNWCFMGVTAEAEVLVPTSTRPGSTIVQTISSGGLWGVESDSDASYFAEIEQEQLSELREQLHAIGFSNRAISAAFKSIEREGN